jgi:hypothetical protein
VTSNMGEHYYYPEQWPSAPFDNEDQDQEAFRGMTDEDILEVSLKRSLQHSIVADSIEKLHNMISLEKWVTLSKSVINSIRVQDESATHLFSVSPEESEIIDHPNAIFLLGRSGMRFSCPTQSENTDHQSNKRYWKDDDDVVSNDRFGKSLLYDRRSIQQRSDL